MPTAARHDPIDSDLAGMVFCCKTDRLRMTVDIPILCEFSLEEISFLHIGVDS